MNKDTLGTVIIIIITYLLAYIYLIVMLTDS